MSDAVSNEIASELLARREALLERLAKYQSCLRGIQDQIMEVKGELEDCKAAGRLFGVVVELPQDTIADTSLRNLMLRRLQYDAPFRIADHRDEIVKEYGRHVHPKSLGMTLYRLKKDGLAKNQGHSWFLNR